MLACVDVHYREDQATAAGVWFERWTDREPIRELTTVVRAGAPYRAGELYLRELPAILAVLEAAGEAIEGAIVDGYVWLDGGKSGLGAHLFEALGGRVPVIGVAKTRYRSADRAVELCRGASTRPLYVSAAGLEVAVAAERIASMHGPSRIPALIQRADQLSRGR